MVQGDCAIFGVPNITVDDFTERPGTIECENNVVISADSKMITRVTEISTSQLANWIARKEYLAEDLAQTISKPVLETLSLRTNLS